jgi:NAD(P)-dependent dehydrogenase (short-subunit alcohol dehydrogenase family)
MNPETTLVHRPITVVTGAASGIGRAVAAYLAAEGHVVLAADLNADQAAAAARDIPNARVAALDVTDFEACERVVGRWAADGFVPSGLVNCAGIRTHVMAIDGNMDHWRRTLEVNLLGTYAMCVAVARSMIPNGGGAIVNIASTRAQLPGPGRGAYSVSKAGVVMLTRCLALEWAAYGIRVNSVSPGYIRTPINVHAFEDPEYEESVFEQTPMRRSGDAVEVARAIDFLLSGSASYITGHDLVVDGGNLAGDPRLPVPPGHSEPARIETR